MTTDSVKVLTPLLRGGGGSQPTRGKAPFLLLAESHISVHTWPEEGLAAIDIFTCGEMDADSIRWLRERLHPQRERLTTVERGEPE